MPRSAALLVALLPALVQAQDVTLRDPADDYRCAIGGAIDIGMVHVVRAAGTPIIVPPGPSNTVDFAGLSASVDGTCRPVPALELRLVIPFVVVGFVAPDGSRSPAIAEPFVAASWVYEWPAARLRLGGGVAIPAERSIHAQDAGWALRGGEEPWLWTTNALGIVGLASIETRALPVYAALELGGGGFVPVDPPPLRFFLPDALLSARATLAWRPIASVEVGARGVVTYVLFPSGDDALASISPFARFDLDTWFLDASFTLNVAGPYGPWLDPGSYWSARVSGGGRFDWR